MVTTKKTSSSHVARRMDSAARSEAKRQAATNTLLPSGKPTAGLKAPKNTSWRDGSRDSIVASLDVGATAMFSHEADLSKMSNMEVTRDTLHDTLRPMRQVFNSTIHRVMARVGERINTKYTTTSQVQFWDNPARIMLVVTVTRIE